MDNSGFTSRTLEEALTAQEAGTPLEDFLHELMQRHAMSNDDKVVLIMFAADLISRRAAQASGDS